MARMEEAFMEKRRADHPGLSDEQLVKLHDEECKKKKESKEKKDSYRSTRADQCVVGACSATRAGVRACIQYTSEWAEHHGARLEC